jgi:hypothetical protein
MALRTKSRQVSPRSPVRQTASWLALLATTTLGAQSSTLLAEIQFDDAKRRPRDEAPQRLIVQVYPVSPTELSETSRPCSSTQRSVTHEDLKRGVAVQLVDVAPAPIRGPDAPLTVVAWLEPGDPDLELDALNARPRSDGPMGTASIDKATGRVRVELRGSPRAA